MKNLKAALATIVISMLPGLAGATIVYDTWTTNEGDTGNYTLTVTESGSVFNVELTIDPWNAEAVALFIDLGDNDLTDTTLSNANPLGEISVHDTDTSSNDCGAGCNLNGGLSPPVANPDGQWEWVIRLADTGFDNIQTFSFDIATNGLTEGDWGLVGIRAQQLCTDPLLLPTNSDDCNGSDKSYASGGPGTPPTPVPEPGALALLGLGLIGLRITARR